MQINDLIRQALLVEGYGQLGMSANDLVQDWLLTVTNQSGNIHVRDLWRAFLTQNGFTSNDYNDDMTAYLKSLGYQGETLNELSFQWWSDRANP